MQRLEHDCRVVGERWDEPDVGRTPELDAAGPAFAREVDDLTELADVVPVELLDAPPDDGERGSRACHVLARHPRLVRATERAHEIAGAKRAQHCGSLFLCERGEEPPHDPDVPDLDRRAIESESAAFERLDEQGEDLRVCDRTGRADKLDAGLHDLALARGHRRLLTEYRSEVREAERTGGFAVALGDEPRYGRREVRTQGD